MVDRVTITAFEGVDVDLAKGGDPILVFEGAPEGAPTFQGIAGVLAWPGGTHTISMFSVDYPEAPDIDGPLPQSWYDAALAQSPNKLSSGVVALGYSVDWSFGLSGRPTSGELVERGDAALWEGAQTVTLQPLKPTVGFSLDLGGGADRVTGFGGDDVFRGQGGKDNLRGGDGDDELSGGKGADELRGQDGEDVIFGGDGADVIMGGLGADILHGEDGDDEIYADEDDDLLFGGDGDDLLHGEWGADSIFGGADHDSIMGGRGKDLVRAGGGKDLVQGGKGADRLNGDGGRDKLFGDGGGDTVAGGAGKDVLFGGAGADSLWGMKGDDVLRGGAGRDDLMSSKGADAMFGGGGADVFMMLAEGGIGRATVRDFSGGDSLLFDRARDFRSFDDFIDRAADTRKGVKIDLDGGWLLLKGVSLDEIAPDQVDWI